MTDPTQPIADEPANDGPTLEDAKAAPAEHMPDPAAAALPTDVKDGAAGEPA